nr:MAG TPA: portal protein [Caudoviricetes sp.]
MFQSIFGKGEISAGQDAVNAQQMRMLNGYENVFTPWRGKAYDDAVVRSCVDAIARHAAKMKLKHIRRGADGRVMETKSNLDFLLSTRPNEYMSSYDFLYKLTSQYMAFNNAFVYIRLDNSTGKVIGLYPLDYDSVELVKKGGGRFLRFNFLGAGIIAVPYSEVIHLRRHFNRSEFYGESSERPLSPTLSIMETVKQGLVNAVKNSGKLRGILKYNAKIRPEDMKKQTQAFVDSFLSSEQSSGGVGAVDNSMDYTALQTDIKTTDYEQMKFIREDIYRYFGISENIVQSKYTEAEFTAFYESILEPLAVQLSLEFTSKIFTEREKAHGNEILFLTDRLQYASLQSKTAMAKQLLPAGIITLNEARELFGYAGVEGGDKRQVSLNFVDADKQNDYQGVGDNKKSKKGGDDDENEPD